MLYHQASAPSPWILLPAWDCKTEGILQNSKYSQSTVIGSVDLKTIQDWCWPKLALFILRLDPPETSTRIELSPLRHTERGETSINTCPCKCICRTSNTHPILYKIFIISPESGICHFWRPWHFRPIIEPNWSVETMDHIYNKSFVIQDSWRRGVDSESNM